MKKVMLISQESHEIRVAILENSILEEFYIERPEALKLYGNIYKGIVKALVPGIGASFVNLGTEKDGFLYLEEEELSEITDIDDNFFSLGLFKKQAQTFNDEKLKEGQEVIVQVVKEPIRNKGPRLTRRVSIPARYLVMIPGGRMLGISRRIEDKEERERIKSIFSDMSIPIDAGFIVRTAGEGKDKKDFMRDIKYLAQKWKQIKSEIRKTQAPALVHQELELIERVIRDNVTDDITKVIVDRKEVHQKVQRYISLHLSGFKGDVELATGKKNLFDKYNIEKEIEKTYRRKVDLKCKGHIVIEQTEGLVAIDVNSGRFTGDDDLEATAFRTNCEAAREIARQLRLRDVGGIVIIDFIDMAKSEHRKKVYAILEQAVQRDRAKTNVLQISKLGLVEMTRQRMRPSLESAVYSVCPYCEGRGVVRSVVTMTIKTIREIKKVLVDQTKKELEVRVHADVAQRLLEQENDTLRNIEKTHKSRITIIPQDAMHIEDISISL